MNCTPHTADNGHYNLEVIIDYNSVRIAIFYGVFRQSNLSHSPYHMW